MDKRPQLEEIFLPDCMDLLYSTLLYSTLLYSTLLYSTLLYSTLLYSTLLYSTLYSTLLYSTLLYSTVRSASSWFQIVSRSRIESDRRPGTEDHLLLPFSRLRCPDLAPASRPDA
ncbi:Hypp7838 [Branchiostoma lanceolatum]|uniref:Hypp7838 protein n=1 Tax=Branchiostoma lanceolatum TaxID=7740 RepID=A0A8K0EFN8_BRALA|nr:Hypp7838 [Branchiostoma lanceolatum]